MDKNNRISEVIRSMTLEERVGQLFIFAFPGKDSRLACDMIDRFGIGGCYISQDNAETFEEARQLCDDLQNKAMSKNPKLPLILGVDQEGAWGVLIPESVIGPGNLALGLSDDTTLTGEMYGVFAKEMLSVGYQTIFGPCADINLNPQNPIIGTRSFGESPDRVSIHTAAAVKSLKKNGAVATAKHFPGHGDTCADSHRDIPVVDKSLKTLKKEELLPFQAAIDAGVDIIMTGHILYPQLDDKYPATLSSAILTDLLRKDMNFQGPVITDSMNMGAIRKHFSPEEATLKALNAGADLIMLSEEHYNHNDAYLENQIALIQSVLNAVKSGKLSIDLVDEKLARVIELKLRIDKKRLVSKNEAIMSYEAKKTIEKKVAASAMRVLQNSNNALPLNKKDLILLVNATPRSSYKNLMNARGIGPNQTEPAFDGFIQKFESGGYHFDHCPHESISEFDFGKYDKILAVTEDHPLPGEDFEKTKQIELIQKLVREQNDKLVVLGLRSPYDLLCFPEAGAYVCAYSGRSCSAEAAVDFLSNKN